MLLPTKDKESIKTEFSPIERKTIKIVVKAYKVLIWAYAIGGLLVIVKILLGKEPQWEDAIFITVAVLFFGYKINRILKKK